MVGLALVFQGLEVVGDGHQVDFRRQLHGGMAPIAVGEDAELARGHDGLELILDGLHLLLAVIGPGGQALAQFGRLLGVGLDGGGDVHPVQGREMVKMHHVIMHGVGGDDQVADVLGVKGHFHLEGVLHGPDRGEGVDRGADAADALGEGGGVPGVAALEDDLDAAPHLARGPGVGDLAAINFTLYA